VAGSRFATPSPLAPLPEIVEHAKELLGMEIAERRACIRDEYFREWW
jgi:hypothetical protein